MSSGRGFDFLVEIFPNVDKTMLSEMCSNIKNDDEMDRVVASLLEGVDEMSNSRDHEVPQAVEEAKFLQSDNLLQVGMPKPPPADCDHLWADMRCCGTGKCTHGSRSEPLDLSKNRSYARHVALQDKYGWPTPLVPQSVDYFSGPGFVPRLQPQPAMQYSYQIPAQPPYLQQFCTPPVHNWLSSTNSVPFSMPVYTQARGNHAAWLSGPSRNFGPVSLEGNGRVLSDLAGHAGGMDRIKALHPEKESQHASTVAGMTSRLSETMPRIENGYGCLEHPSKCECSVLQENVAGRSALSKTIVAYHYLALVTILPDADPAFIRKKCEEINGSVNGLQKFVLEALTLNNYDKNCSVSVVEEKSSEKISPPAVQGVLGSLHLTEEHQESSVVHAGGDGTSIPDGSEASAVYSEESTSESNILQDSTTSLLPSEIVHQTSAEEANQDIEVALSDASSDDLSNFEVLECINMNSGDVSVNAACIVSSESEFELSVVKLDDMSNENESCEFDADVQELEISTSSSAVDKTAVASEVVAEDVSSCDKGSSSVHHEEICVEVEAADSELSTTASSNSTEFSGSSDVHNDNDVSLSGDCSSKMDVSLTSEVLDDHESGVSLFCNPMPVVTEEGGDDPEDLSRQPVEFVPLVDISEPENDDLPPELFTIDPDISVDTANDYEIARMISEQDEACALRNDPLEEQISMLLNFMPEADPSYLKDICERYGKDEAKLLALVQQGLDSNKFPTFEDYLKRQETLNVIRESLNQMTVSMFVSVYPRPFVYFYGTRQKEQSETDHELGFLQMRYRNISNEDLQAVLHKCDHSLTMSCKELDTWVGPTQHMRGDWECRIPTDMDMSFIHEVFFIENEREIREYLELESFRENVLNRARFMEAKLECPICCDDELEIVQMAACMDGHLFCKDCVKRNAETRIGDGLTKFPCLEESCNAEFGTRTLESLLNHTLFTRMVQQRSLEEVESAHLEDLVRCPFCEYAAILPPEISVLECENPECMKQTCRYCKEPDHKPLRCNEVEKEGETKMRTEIEDRMSDALIRKCNSCGKKFVKSDGCNKMACPCGAIMCYLCRKTVKDYSHFNGMGGTDFYKCPLFSDDNYVHREEVKKAAAHAKADVMARNPGLELKNDPTTLLP